MLAHEHSIALATACDTRCAGAATKPPPRLRRAAVSPCLSQVKELGVVVAHGDDVSDWRGRLIVDLAIHLARAGVWEVGGRQGKGCLEMRRQWSRPHGSCLQLGLPGARLSC